MLKPETYHATTKSGKTISETAQDANSYLDYPSVESAIENVEKVIEEEFKKISNAIANVKMGKEALCVQDTSMQPVIDEMSEFIQGIPGRGITSLLEDTKSKALQIHDDKQREYNEEAEKKVKARAQSEE